MSSQELKQYLVHNYNKTEYLSRLHNMPDAKEVIYLICGVFFIFCFFLENKKEELEGGRKGEREERAGKKGRIGRLFLSREGICPPTHTHRVKSQEKSRYFMRT